MKGKLIVIEGTDGSGKQTQTELLYNNLKNRNLKVKKISFPNYKSPACEPVKMYLSGEFGNIDDISIFASSCFYAIDRYASFKKEWEELYNDGYIIISDRYTISNIIHQANRIKDDVKFNNYIDWLIDLEWNKFSLPKPDITIFLDMPYEYSNELIKNRANKFTGNDKKDILEDNEKHKILAYNAALRLCDKFDKIIKCIDNDKIKSIDAIQGEILEYIDRSL